MNLLSLVMQTYFCALFCPSAAQLSLAQSQCKDTGLARVCARTSDFLDFKKNKKTLAYLKRLPRVVLLPLMFLTCDAEFSLHNVLNPPVQINMVNLYLHNHFFNFLTTCSQWSNLVIKGLRPKQSTDSKCDDVGTGFLSILLVLNIKLNSSSGIGYKCKQLYIQTQCMV